MKQRENKIALLLASNQCTYISDIREMRKDH